MSERLRVQLCERESVCDYVCEGEYENNLNTPIKC